MRPAITDAQPIHQDDVTGSGSQLLHQERGSYAGGCRSFLARETPTGEQGRMSFVTQARQARLVFTDT